MEIFLWDNRAYLEVFPLATCVKCVRMPGLEDHPADGHVQHMGNLLVRHWSTDTHSYNTQHGQSSGTPLKHRHTPIQHTTWAIFWYATEAQTHTHTTYNILVGIKQRLSIITSIVFYCLYFNFDVLIIGEYIKSELNTSTRLVPIKYVKISILSVYWNL